MSSALVLAWPARPHPPTTASVSSTQVLPATEGSPAAAATRSVNWRTTESCFSRSSAPALVSEAKTVKDHQGSAYGKLQVSSRAELAGALTSSD